MLGKSKSKGLKITCIRKIMIAFRISKTYDDLLPFVERLSQKCSRLIVYEHNESARIHIHGLVADCEISTDTLKNYVKSSLNVTTFPKSDWSFITQDKQGNSVNDSFITYMSKGVLQFRFNKGYTTESIEQYRMSWKPIAKQKIQYILKQENPQEAKKRQIDLVNEICRRVDSEGFVLAEEIIKVICDVVYKENRTIIGRYKIRDYYDMVMYRTQPQAFIRSIKNLCLKE